MRHALKIEDFNNIERETPQLSMGFQLRDVMETGKAFPSENEASIEQVLRAEESPFMVRAEEVGELVGSEYSSPAYNIRSPPAANYLYRDF